LITIGQATAMVAASAIALAVLMAVAHEILEEAHRMSPFLVASGGPADPGARQAEAKGLADVARALERRPDILYASSSD